MHLYSTSRITDRYGEAESYTIVVGCMYTPCLTTPYHYYGVYVLPNQSIFSEYTLMSTLQSELSKARKGGATVRAASGLDSKAYALGIWTLQYHRMSRRLRSIAVNVAYQKAKQA